MHAAFVAFVVGGQAAILVGWGRGWQWTRAFGFRAVHLAAIGLVVLESWLDIPCSLTVLEDALRARSGAQGYEQGFIADWLTRLIYYSAPAWVFTVVYTLAGALILATFVLYPPIRRR